MLAEQVFYTGSVSKILAPALRVGWLLAPPRYQDTVIAAKRYADLFGVFLKHRGVIDRVTFWGVADADSWLNDWPVRGRTSYPLLFDRRHQPIGASGERPTATAAASKDPSSTTAPTTPMSPSAVVIAGLAPMARNASSSSRSS